MANEKPTFSQLVCGAPDVRAAFESHRGAHWWWQLILHLHGKPVASTLSRAQETRQIAEGFRFYARLYRFLAVVFLLLGPLLLATDVDENNVNYWAASSLLAGVYLWFCSGLGFAGARDYADETARGAVVLVAFMAMIVAFLSAFVAGVSVVAAQLNWLASAPNLAATSALFVVGVGSYFIEIVYLVSRENSAHQT